MSESRERAGVCGNCESAPWEPAYLRIVGSKDPEVAVHVCRACGMFEVD